MGSVIPAVIAGTGAGTVLPYRRSRWLGGALPLRQRSSHAHLPLLNAARQGLRERDRRADRAQYPAQPSLVSMGAGAREVARPWAI